MLQGKKDEIETFVKVQDMKNENSKIEKYNKLKSSLVNQQYIRYN